jgi:hypothetical protein
VQQQPDSGLGIDQTHLDTNTTCRAPLNERSARHKARCSQDTHLTQQTNFLTLSGNRNLDLSSQANLDACPKPHGHQERQLLVTLENKLVLTLLFIVEEFVISNIRE